MIEVRMRLLMYGCLLALGAGCAPRPAPLPSYRFTDDSVALHDLSARAREVQNVSAAAGLTLTRPDGNSVRLDAALVISLPEQSVRLRAWKFDQTVFDLTLTHGTVWIETPHDQGRREQVLPASLSAVRLARALSVFNGKAFEGVDVHIVDTGGQKFSVRKPLSDGQTLIAEVDRSTLTVARYQLAGPGGTIHFTLDLRDYRSIQGVLWPAKWIARSDGGTIEVDLRDIEINSALPPGAFIPPHGAEKMP